MQKVFMNGCDWYIAESEDHAVQLEKEFAGIDCEQDAFVEWVGELRVYFEEIYDACGGVGIPPEASWERYGDWGIVVIASESQWAKHGKPGVPLQHRVLAMKKSDCPNKDAHTPSPSGYLDWHAWAERMIQTHKQAQCDTCGLWAIWLPIERDEQKQSANERNDPQANIWRLIIFRPTNGRF